jgi:hypothetical protein
MSSAKLIIMIKHFPVYALVNEVPFSGCIGDRKRFGRASAVHQGVEEQP